MTLIWACVLVAVSFCFFFFFVSDYHSNPIHFDNNNCKHAKYFILFQTKNEDRLIYVAVSTLDARAIIDCMINGSLSYEKKT